MILLDYTDRRPIYEQVMDRLQDLILKGVLPRDASLPSVRSLAMELSINPNTIQRAYAELEREGWIYSVKGKGSFVAAGNEVLEGKRKAWRLKMGMLVDEAALLKLSREDIHETVDEHWKQLLASGVLNRQHAPQAEGEIKGGSEQ